MAKGKVAGRDFEVQHKPRSRKPREIADLSASAYLQTVMESLPQPVEPPPPVPLEGVVLPPLPEGHIPRTVDEFLTRISELWEDAQQRFLRIGELLAIAETRLTSEERATLFEVLNRRFGKSARSQLMSAYRAIQDRTVPSEMAAAGYGTVYMLSRLSNDERQEAAKVGLLRPDVRQSEVREFVRSIRGPASAETRVAALEAKRARLLAELEKVERELENERASLID
jgi:hypothetical protein